MIYTCPMHPEIEQSVDGRCHICGMALVPKKDATTLTAQHDHVSASSYTPLFIIIGLIVLTTTAIAVRSWLMNEFTWIGVMINFMAGFFLVFAGFKLLDLKGFAHGYATYDLLAQQIFTYGDIYPCILYTSPSPRGPKTHRMPSSSRN